MSLFNVAVAAVALAVGAFIGQVLRNLGFTIVRPTPVCDDPGQPGCGSNPRQCGTSQVIVFGPGGTLAVFDECGDRPATWVTTQENGTRGVDAGARAQFLFAPSREVQVRVKHFGQPGRIEAFEISGAIAAIVMMGPAANVEQQFTLRGAAINRVDVTPGSPTDRTVVLGWCH
jgi:hypothetical protein